VELHRDLLPGVAWHDIQASREPSHWSTWNRLTVDRVGDCVGFWVPNFGNMAIPAGDFVNP
jgi:hypothetical protein